MRFEFTPRKAVIINGKKKCIGCDRWLDLKSFPRTSTLSYGSRCKPCAKEKIKQYILSKRNEP